MMLDECFMTKHPALLFLFVTNRHCTHRRYCTLPFFKHHIEPKEEYPDDELDQIFENYVSLLHWKQTDYSNATTFKFSIACPHCKFHLGAELADMQETIFLTVNDVIL